MRLRLPEVLEERGLTAYEVAARSDGRISESTLYRLIRQRGVVRNFSAELLEALCDVLEVDIGALITRDPPPPERERSPSVMTSQDRAEWILVVWEEERAKFAKRYQRMRRALPDLIPFAELEMPFTSRQVAERYGRWFSLNLSRERADGSTVVLTDREREKAMRENMRADLDKIAAGKPLPPNFGEKREPSS